MAKSASRPSLRPVKGGRASGRASRKAGHPTGARGAAVAVARRLAKAGHGPDDPPPPPDADMDLDFGYSTLVRGHELSDRREREAYPGLKLRSAYLSIVGENPDLLPGDVQGAAQVLARIEAAIAQGGWTRAEWRRLHQMRWKWHHRAAGTDPRFMVVGNRKTGLTAEESRLVEVKRILLSISADLDGNQVD